MNLRLAYFALLVRDYDEAITFYTEKLGFTLIEDTRISDTKRWVVVRPPGANNSQAAFLLAKAASPDQQRCIGNQSGGRVFIFLHTDNFDECYERLSSVGIEFVRGPAVEPYGKVAVFKDLYGNLFDLIEPTK